MTDPYGTPSQPQPPNPYQAPAAPVYGAPAYVAPPTNTLAVVSMIFGIASWVVLPFVAALVSVITGHISLGQIKRTHESGRGMALAGVILGWVNIGLTVVLIVVLILLGIGIFSVAATSGGLNS